MAKTRNIQGKNSDVQKRVTNTLNTIKNNELRKNSLKNNQSVPC